MAGRPEHALIRALTDATVGLHNARLDHERELVPDSGADYAQHIKVPVKGIVGPDPIESDVKVIFPLAIIYAPNKSQSSAMEEPHMLSGVHVPEQPGRPKVECALLDWIVTEEVWFTGAIVRVTAYIPFAPKLAAFHATLHLTFYGWAAPLEVIDVHTDG